MTGTASSSSAKRSLAFSFVYNESAFYTHIHTHRLILRGPEAQHQRREILAGAVYRNNTQFKSFKSRFDKSCFSRCCMRSGSSTGLLLVRDEMCRHAASCALCPSERKRQPPAVRASARTQSSKSGPALGRVWPCGRTAKRPRGRFSLDSRTGPARTSQAARKNVPSTGLRVWENTKVHQRSIATPSEYARKWDWQASTFQENPK